VLQEQATLLDLAHDAILVRDMDYKITYWNEGAEKTYGWTKEEALGEKAHEFLHTEFPGPLGEIFEEVLRAGQWEGELCHIDRIGKPIVVMSRWATLRDSGGELVGILEINRDITERKKAELEREKLISELQDAVARIRTLSDLLPICSHCKKIRNDEGYWEQIESYIHQHSGTQFSHGICPDCLKEHYSQFLGDKLDSILEKAKRAPQ
jgi:PAS domain S-box-containing protein